MSNDTGKIVLAVLLIISIIWACSTPFDTSFRNQYTEQNKILHTDTSSTQFYKLHLNNGDVAVLETWSNVQGDSIVGQGRLYDPRRDVKHQGLLSFHIDDIAIGETNDYTMFEPNDEIRKEALGVLIAFNLAINVTCAIRPKACFGSCPTFYVEGNNNLRSCNAEGFSHAITPSLQSRDIDDLQYSSSGEHFELTIKNEALETHVIDKVELLAFQKNESEQVLQSKDAFYLCSDIYELFEATNTTRDVTQHLRYIDDDEYFLSTDSTDLFAQDELILAFDAVDGIDKGLVLNFRQSLITTFLLYNGLSYLGDEVTDYIAKYEHHERYGARIFQPIYEKSQIKVLIWNERKAKWQGVDEVFEIGPIAKNKILVPLPDIKNLSQGQIKIKLVMPQGHWRLDYAAITEIKGKIKPMILQPYDITFNNRSSQDLRKCILEEGDQKMITIPGDVAVLSYDLPCYQQKRDYQLMVAATGYYLEWMRMEWLQDKDISSFEKMLSLDSEFWTNLAKEYKEQEEEAEAFFWNSHVKLEL